MMLAFPLSGITWSVVNMARDTSFVVHHPFGSLVLYLIRSAWLFIFTPLYGGFPITDEGGVDHMNMYPYIIPTGLVLFFLLSKGWRWFKTPTVSSK